MNIQEAKQIRTEGQQAVIDFGYTRFENNEDFFITNNDSADRMAMMLFYLDLDRVVAVPFDANEEAVGGVFSFTDFDQYEIFLQHQLKTGCVLDLDGCFIGQVNPKLEAGKIEMAKFL